MMMDEDLRQLQLDYLTDVREKIAVIRRHGRSLERTFKQSFPALLFLAHQLKGSGGSLGFPHITELAERMKRELNLFLDDEVAHRPRPQDLAATLAALSNELEQEVTAAEKSL
jgi:HPt (histidine-containing phosphotransfer) domain-containing protein